MHTHSLTHTNISHISMIMQSMNNIIHIRSKNKILFQTIFSTKDPGHVENPSPLNQLKLHSFEKKESG